MTVREERKNRIGRLWPCRRSRRLSAAIRCLSKLALIGGLAVLTGTIAAHYATLPPILQVPASAETETFSGNGDALDDPAVWVDPNDPEKSLIIASVKGFGLVVYDLNGRLVQSLNDGDIDNVDIRQNLTFSYAPMTLVAASRRNDRSIRFYTVDPRRHRLVRLPQRKLIAHNDIYGICLHHDRKTDYVSVFVTGHDGVVEQWAIFRDQRGMMDGRRIRKFKLHTVAEGCVADDDLGRVYVAEENHGIVWFDTDPTHRPRKHWVDRIISGVLRQDVEGLTLYEQGAGRGYLLASSQGNSTIVVYDRRDNRCLGRFHISENPVAHVDEVTETDGIVAVSAPMGKRYPSGLLVAQDDMDKRPKNKQNLKLVSFMDIIRALESSGARGSS